MPYPFSAGEVLTNTNLNNAIDDIVVAVSFAPGGDDDANTSGLTDWVTLTSGLVVPSWVGSAIVQMSVSGVTCVTATHSFFLNAKIGSVAGSTACYHEWGATGQFASFSYTSVVTSPTTGTTTLIVQHNRVGASGATRATTNSRFSATVRFCD